MPAAVQKAFSWGTPHRPRVALAALVSSSLSPQDRHPCPVLGPPPLKGILRVLKSGHLEVGVFSLLGFFPMQGWGLEGRGEQSLFSLL